MKKIILLISIILTVSIAQAENAQRNENQSILYAAETDTGPIIGVDRYGNMQCTLKAGTASATNPIKLEDSASASGDAGIQALAVRNEAAASFADANGDYSPFAVNRFGNMYVTMSSSMSADGNSPIRAEDDAFAASNGLMMSGGVNNRNFSAFNSTNGDVTPLAVGDTGALLSTLVFDSGLGSASGQAAIRLEDSAFANGSALIPVSGIAVSAIAQSVDTTGDLAPPSMDLGNRLVTTNAPAGESWYACTGEITTATNTSLKGLVASNRHYVTSFGCAATSTNPNQIYLTDGSGGTAMDLVTTTSNAVAPSVQNTYPVPLRGSSGVALFVTTITTGAVRCCASGYISTI